MIKDNSKEFMHKNKPIKNILFLGFVSLLNDISSEMITPILPLLIKQLGGTGVAIGLIGGLRDSISQIFKIIFGYLSDRFKNRKFLIFSGYMSSACAKLLLIGARSWSHIFICVGFDRIGKAMREAPRDVLITLSIPNNVGSGFGIHRAFDSVGAILGSLFVLLLTAFWYTKISTIIFISFFFGLATIIPLYFVKDIKNDLSTETKINFFSLSQSLKTFIIIHSIFLFADINYMFFILHAHNTLSSSYTSLTPIILYVLYNLFYTLFAAPFGILSDDIDRCIVLIIGYILFGLTCIGFYYAQTILMFVPLFCLYGTTHACTKVVARSIVSDLSSQYQRGTALGGFESIGGFASLFVGLLIGILWDSLPHKYIFLSLSFVVIIASCLLIFFKKRLQSRH